MAKPAPLLDAALSGLNSLPQQDLDLDRLIDRLEEKEAEIRRTMAPTIRGGSFSIASLKPAERAQAVAVPDRCEKLLAEALADLRDTRWRLMARRADVEDPGDAPVFDNPDDLIAYLDAQDVPHEVHS